jgi:hypothetical protein
VTGDEEWNRVCPWCKSDQVEFDERDDVPNVELEHWGCLACKKGFEVDVRIVRVRARRDEV